GRERQKEIGSAAETSSGEPRKQLLASRSRIGRRLEHDELPGAETAGDVIGRFPHVGEVRLAMTSERGRNADDDGITRPDLVKIVRSRDAAPAKGGRDSFGSDVPDIGL